jgi:hypothetical protein
MADVKKEPSEENDETGCRNKIQPHGMLEVCQVGIP